MKKYHFLIPLYCISLLVSGFRAVITVNIATIEATCGNSNGTMIVTATGGTAPYQYSKDGVTFQNSNTFAGVGPGPYTITVTDVNGNTGTGNAAISNLPGPTVAATATTATCPNNDGSITVRGVGGTSPYTYSIDGTNYQNNASFPGVASGNYTATVKDLNGCISNPKAIAVPITNNLTVNAGNDTTICQGSIAVLTGTSNGTSFSWAPSAGFSDPSSPDPKVSPVTTTKYDLTVTWGVCQQAASVTVNVNAAPIAIAGPDASVCSGKSIQLSGSGGKTYVWSPATYLDQPTAADATVNDPAAGSITYHLVVTDQNGCHSLQDAQTTITVLAPPRISAGNDTSLLLNQTITLHAVDLDNSGLTQYVWSPATGLNNPSIQDPEATPEESTTYTVTGSTAEGCAGTASVTIKAFTASDLFVPTAFSPNGDGHNDVLRVIAIGIKEFYYFAVYNRYGQRIFYTTDPARGWDGTINGQPQLPDAYVWMTGGIDNQGRRIDRKGTAILVR